MSAPFREPHGSPPRRALAVAPMRRSATPTRVGCRSCVTHSRATRRAHVTSPHTLPASSSAPASHTGSACSAMCSRSRRDDDRCRGLRAPAPPRHRRVEGAHGRERHRRRSRCGRRRARRRRNLLLAHLPDQFAHPGPSRARPGRRRSAGDRVGRRQWLPSSIEDRTTTAPVPPRPGEARWSRGVARSRRLTSCTRAPQRRAWLRVCGSSARRAGVSRRLERGGDQAKPEWHRGREDHASSAGIPTRSPSSSRAGRVRQARPPQECASPIGADPRPAGRRCSPGSTTGIEVSGIAEPRLNHVVHVPTTGRSEVTADTTEHGSG